MTRTDEISAEIRNQAVRLYPKCALWHIGGMISGALVMITFLNS